MTNALLLIDYSNDFVALNGKLTCGKPAIVLEDTIAKKWEAYMAKEAPIFVLMDMHFENDTLHPETRLFPPHNIKGTAGRNLYGKLHQLYLRDQDKKNVFWIDKMRYSAFSGTPLFQLLRERNINTIELAGVCTDICVLHTAVDGYNLGFDMVVDEHAVASFNSDGHKFALAHFKNVLGMTVEEID
ncbi:cysteine hydrolase family protein [Macrococcus sp. EM39E]|uniref:cysteine hydrolase family protein n=1 Tax=Macrococcus animalis TaxID=3395467 RepID=UPI0039BDCA43